MHIGLFFSYEFFSENVLLRHKGCFITTRRFFRVYRLRGHAFLNNESIDKGLFFFSLHTGQVGLDPNRARFLNFSSAKIKNLDLSFLLALFFDHEFEDFSKNYF